MLLNTAKHNGNLLHSNKKLNVAETNSSKQPLQDTQKVKNEFFEDGVYIIVASFFGDEHGFFVDLRL
jgi:hypothetical protein